jgi:general secretion pathway protein G
MHSLSNLSSPRRRASHPGARGFTLIELLLVMVILGTLAAIVVPKFAGRTEQAKIAAAKTDISGFKTALDAFEVDNGYYPSSSEGLNPLLNAPADAKDWHGPYLDKVSVDPWGAPYVYEFPGKHNANGYDLMSNGPDGRAGTGDDITNWQ